MPRTGSSLDEVHCIGTPPSGLAVKDLVSGIGGGSIFPLLTFAVAEIAGRCIALVESSRPNILPGTGARMPRP